MLENRWKPFLNKILLKNDYNIVSSRIKNQTETIHYRSTIANPATEIRVGYLKPNLLIFLTIYNPEVPGYNTSFKGEYFDQYSFHPKKNYGNPGLEYNEMNKVGLTKELQNPIRGHEIQILKNSEVLKSSLFLEHLEFYEHFDFSGRNLFQKVFRKKIENMAGIETKRIELSDIFSGLENMEF